jgi:glutamate-1-semialdehyde aminotransferase
MAETPFMLLSDGYHGHGDEWVSLTPPAMGVPPVHAYIRQLPNDFTDDQIAEADAVILEPVKVDASDARRMWLQRLRDSCTRAGTILIFDEVVTGFRFPKYSVSSFWGIEPDLIVLGKALAGGMPLAAVGGKYAVMNGAEYFVSSTYAGEVLSLAAAKASMTLLQTRHDLNDLWRKGQHFLDQFNSVCPDKVRIEGYPTRGAFSGDPEARAQFFQEACRAGMLFGPSWFYSFPLAEESRDAMLVIKSILGRVARGEVKLEGELPRSPFSQRVREHL